MSTCPNCKATLSCGCQKRVTPDGKVGCSKCINTMKSKLLNPTTQKK